VWAHLPFYTILLPAFLELCYSQTAYSSKVALNNVYRVRHRHMEAGRRGDFGVYTVVVALCTELMRVTCFAVRTAVPAHLLYCVDSCSAPLTSVFVSPAPLQVLKVFTESGEELLDELRQAEEAYSQ
jgi:hypothetical protein